MGCKQGQIELDTSIAIPIFTILFLHQYSTMGYWSFGEPHSANNYYNCASVLYLHIGAPHGLGFALLNAMQRPQNTQLYWAAESVNIRKVTPEEERTKEWYPHGWVEVQVAWQDGHGEPLGLQWQSLEHICDQG